MTSTPQSPQTSSPPDLHLDPQQPLGLILLAALLNTPEHPKNTLFALWHITLLFLRTLITLITSPQKHQLLNLDRPEKLQILQRFLQPLNPQPPEQPSHRPTLATAIAQFRANMSPEELDPNADDIWQDVRDRTPVSNEPRW